jgi:hypothetical protein
VNDFSFVFDQRTDISGRSFGCLFMCVCTVCLCELCVHVTLCPCVSGKDSELDIFSHSRALTHSVCFSLFLAVERRDSVERSCVEGSYKYRSTSDTKQSSWCQSSKQSNGICVIVLVLRVWGRVSGGVGIFLMNSNGLCMNELVVQENCWWIAK